jgi:hypothetical protein
VVVIGRSDSEAKMMGPDGCAPGAAYVWAVIVYRLKLAVLFLSGRGGTGWAKSLRLPRQLGVAGLS